MLISMCQLLHRKIIVLDISYDLMRLRLEDGEKFNDQADTVQRRVATYRETTEAVITAHSGSIRKVLTIPFTPGPFLANLGERSSTIIVCTDYCNSRK